MARHITRDGLAIAQVCLEYLDDTVGCRSVFARHFHKLADAVDTMHHATCMAMDSSTGRYGDLFAYRTSPGRAGRSHALKVAALAGMPVAVLTRAGKLLKAYTGEP